MFNGIQMSLKNLFRHCKMVPSLPVLKADFWFHPISTYCLQIIWISQIMVILQKFCSRKDCFNLLFMKVISVEKAVKAYYSGQLGSCPQSKGFMNTSILKPPCPKTLTLPGKSTSGSAYMIFFSLRFFFVLSGGIFQCLLTQFFGMLLGSLTLERSLWLLK